MANNNNSKATSAPRQRNTPPPSMAAPAITKVVPKLPKHGPTPAENSLKQQQQLYSSKNKNKRFITSKPSTSAKSANADVVQQPSSNKNKKPPLAKSSLSAKFVNAAEQHQRRSDDKNKKPSKTSSFVQLALAAEQQKSAALVPLQQRSSNTTGSKQEWSAFNKENHRLKLPHQGKKRNNHKSFPVMLPKARRAELRREIASMTDALQNLELSSSPPSSSGESSDSDSISGSSRRPKKGSVKQQNQRSSSNAAVVSKLGSTAFPVLMKRSQQDQEVDTTKVYCGPCFSNAPAPSALPMPGVTPPPLHGHSATPSANEDGVFAIDELQQQSKELMNLLVPQHHHYRSSVPLAARTAHAPGTMDNALSEIQRGLRSMLKIST